MRRGRGHHHRHARRRAPAHHARVATPTCSGPRPAGMGLTGIVLDATFRLSRIETSLLSVDTDRTPDLDTTLDLMDDRRPPRTTTPWRGSTSWPRAPAMGRSILDRGRFARSTSCRQAPAPRPARRSAPATLATYPALVPPQPDQPAHHPGVQRGLVPQGARAGDATSSRASASSSTRSTWSTGGTGSTAATGLLQWQFVVPLDAIDDLRSIIGQLSTLGLPVVPRRAQAHGPGQPRPAVVPHGGLDPGLRRAGRGRRPARAAARPPRRAGGRRRRPPLPGQGQPHASRAAPGHVPPPRRVAGGAPRGGPEAAAHERPGPPPAPD